jgi:sugar phosphate permease
MMVFACASWSLISFISGSTSSFAVFVLMRRLLGVPQAALLPPAYSFIQKYFPKNKISTANALMTAAPLFG